MKYLMVIGDGMADRPLDRLNGQTPLAYLSLPHFARAAGGTVGYAVTARPGVKAASETAISALLGCPLPPGTGRAALEALGENIAVSPGAFAYRGNLVTLDGDGRLTSYNAGGIDSRQALALQQSLAASPGVRGALQEAGLTLHPVPHFYALLTGSLRAEGLPLPHASVGTDWQAHLRMARRAAPQLAQAEETIRHALTAHPINRQRQAQGLPPANALWCWGGAAPVPLPDFGARFRLRAAAVAGTPLVKGLARAMGMDVIPCPGATGGLDTAYPQKAKAALDALLNGYDFVLLHIEAPDTAGHMRRLDEKLSALRHMDFEVLAPLFEGQPALGALRMLVMPDHYTLVSTGLHDETPVPFALWDSRKPGVPRSYHEGMAGAARAMDAALLMPLLLENPPPAER